jgi:molybdate transport system substrate-binding protein
MKYPWKKLLLTLALAMGVTVHTQAAEHVTVYAAASLTDAIKDIATQYQKQKGVEVTTSFGASSTLALQIEKDAPADLFISADQEWMDYCVSKQKIANNTRHTLLGNNLVLISEKTSNIGKTDINDKTQWSQLLGASKLAVGDPDHVPAGKYAKQALQSLGAWATLEPKLVKAADVRAAMALVERKEALLGIVYGSDALVSSSVIVIGTFPATSHKPIEYPVAIVKGHETAAVKAFYNYLKTSDATTIFKHYGFVPSVSQ